MTAAVRNAAELKNSNGPDSAQPDFWARATRNQATDQGVQEGLLRNLK